MVLLLELGAGPLDAVVKALRLLCHEVVAQGLESLLLVARLLQCGTQVVFLREVHVDNFGRASEVGVEEVFRPCDGVLNAVGETAESTHGERLLRRILRAGIRLGDAWKDDLDVALGTKSATVNQRLVEEDATPVDVSTSIDIVKSVSDAVQTLPEGLIEHLLGFLRDSVLHHVDLALQVRVHGLHSLRSALALQLTNILGPEEELSVEVALLNLVHVGDMNLALGSSGKTNHSPVLQHLATNGTSTNEELIDVGKLLLVLCTENSDLSVVAASNRLAELLAALAGCGQRLE